MAIPPATANETDVKVLRERVNYLRGDNESLRDQVVALKVELDAMRHLAAQPHAIAAVHEHLGPLSLWGAKALERHIEDQLTAITQQRDERQNCGA